MSKKNITKQRFYLQFPTQLFLFIVLIFLGFSCGNEGEDKITGKENPPDRKSTRLNSSHIPLSRMPSSA